MPRFMLDHRHEARECGAVFASFKSFESPLRTRAAIASCGFGGHQIWWEVEAKSEDEALGLLPGFVAERSTASRVEAVEVP